MYQVSFKDNDGFNKCGMWYAPMEIAVANIDNELSQEEIENKCEDYALLCPCISLEDSLNECYTVVFKSWKYRFPSKTRATPELSMQMFLSTLN